MWLWLVQNNNRFPWNSLYPLSYPSIPVLVSVEIQVSWVDVPKIIKLNMWGLSKSFPREDRPMQAVPEQTGAGGTTKKGTMGTDMFPLLPSCHGLSYPAAPSFGITVGWNC